MADHRFTPDDNPHRPDATRCAWCGLGENAHQKPGRVVGVIVPALDADHVPGTDRYDGRDGSIECAHEEPASHNGIDWSCSVCEEPMTVSRETMDGFDPRDGAHV